MGFLDWARKTRSRLRDDGLVGARLALQDLYHGLWRTVGWYVPRGTNVYDREWDTLMVLDACRVDMLRAAGDDYGFLDDVAAITSVGSMTEEWQRKTFTDRTAAETARTAYVTANPFSDRLDGSAFATLAEVWRYGWDEDLGVVPPRAVTDRAIAVAREYDPDRLVVHYLQPHRPLIAGDLSLAADTRTGATADSADGPRPPTRGTPLLGALRRGEAPRSAVLAAYQANLRLALDEVAVLLANHDANTVAITADHGNAFGEWGVYGHPAGCLVPAVRRVPWDETRAEDRETREPGVVASTPEERLIAARETPALEGRILDDDAEDLLAERLRDRG